MAEVFQLWPNARSESSIHPGLLFTPLLCCADLPSPTTRYSYGPDLRSQPKQARVDPHFSGPDVDAMFARCLLMFLSSRKTSAAQYQRAARIKSGRMRVDN